MARRNQPHDPLATTRLWGELIGGPNDLITSDELADLPADPFHYELLKGRLLRMLPPQEEHGDLGGRILVALGIFCKHHHINGKIRTEVGYLLSIPEAPATVFAPAVSYLAPDRPTAVKQGAYRREAPDSAVEIVSPSQFRPEMTDKARIYVAAGVKLVWMVWPATQTIDIWHHNSQEPIATAGIGDTLDGMDVLPGFSVPVAEIFGA